MNDPPTTTNQNLEVEAGELVAIPITAQDVDSEEITLALKGSPGHGTASLDSGTVYYQSDAGYVGMDMVQYTATDEDGASATGTITLTVGVSNMPPVAQAAEHQRARRQLCIDAAYGHRRQRRHAQLRAHAPAAIW